MIYLYVSCSEVREICPGELEVDDVWALLDGFQSHIIRYQKHLVRARYSPVAFSFFSKSCAIYATLIIREELEY